MKTVNKILLLVFILSSLGLLVELAIYFNFVSFAFQPKPPEQKQYNFDSKTIGQETASFSSMLKKVNLFALTNDKIIVNSKIEVEYKGAVKSITQSDGFISVHMDEKNGNPDYTTLKFEQANVAVFDSNNKKINIADVKAGDTVDLLTTYTYKTGKYEVKMIKYSQ